MAERESPVRIGVIGCGQIAQTHFTNYTKIPEAQVVACADINPVAAETSAKTFDIPNVYDSAWEMLKRDDLDAIDVCLHNNLHLSGTLAALESGRHAYCEKPMAGTYRDAEAMAEAAKHNGKRLHIQLSNIYSDEVRAAKELIDAGEIGEIYHARSTGFRRRGRPFVDGYGKPDFVNAGTSGGGALYDMGVYHISELLYLLGNPQVARVSGRTYQRQEMDTGRREQSGYNVEELGVGFVRFENGVTLDIIEAWAIPLNDIEGSCIVGDKGGIRLKPFSFHKTVGDLNLDATASLSSARFRWNALRGEGELFGNSQIHWIAALLGKVEQIPTPEIALNTMLISEGIYLSEKMGREVTAEEIREQSVSKRLPL